MMVDFSRGCTDSSLVDAATRNGRDWAHGTAEFEELARLFKATVGSNITQFAECWERGENGIRRLYGVLYPERNWTFADFLDAAFETADEAAIEPWQVHAFVQGAIEAFEHQAIQKIKRDADGESDATD